MHAFSSALHWAKPQNCMAMENNPNNFILVYRLFYDTKSCECPEGTLHNILIMTPLVQYFYRYCFLLLMNFHSTTQHVCPHSSNSGFWQATYVLKHTSKYTVFLYIPYISPAFHHRCLQLL